MSGTDVAKRFPFINLEKAIGRASQMYSADPRNNEMPLKAAFELWGYSDKSSGGFQTVGALRAYGLMTEEGPKIRLTRAAWDFCRDEREDAKAKALQDFALTPPLLRSLWELWDGSPPADTLARSHLKLERGLNEQSARSLLGIYKDNLAFANLKGGLAEPENPVTRQTEHGKIIDEIGDEIKVGDHVQWTSGGVDQFRPLRQVRHVENSFAFVHGHLGGIPMDELSIGQPPAPRSSQHLPDLDSSSTTGAAQPRRSSEPDDNPISVLLSGSRLQISADVDAKGLEKLEKMIIQYKAILAL